MNPPVLLTGATGYIGGRLLRHFEGAGRPVPYLAPNPERVKATRSTTEVVQGDCLDEASLRLALAGVDSAYYTPLDDGRCARSSARRRRSTLELLRRAYWYVLLPVHEWMFSGLRQEIARRAKLRGIEFDGDSIRWPFVWVRDRPAARSKGVTHQ